MNKTPWPILLGVSPRVSSHGAALDILRLGTTALAPYFPLDLSQYHCLIAVQKSLFFRGIETRFNLNFKTENAIVQETQLEWVLGPSDKIEKPLGDLPPEIRRATPETLSGRAPSVFPVGFAIQRPADGTTAATVHEYDYVTVAVGIPRLIIVEPQSLLITCATNDETQEIGRIVFEWNKPDPISAEEARALRSYATSVKVIRLRVGCNSCGDELALYCALPHGPSGEIKEDFGTNLHDAPETWTCKCTKATFPLIYAKLGVPHFFRMPKVLTSGPSAVIPLYTDKFLANIQANYEKLIGEDHSEEIYQFFLEENAILWGFLSPVKILHKPKILTKKTADFGILTATKKLYLIEIEKPSTQVATKTGGISAELQQGVGQLNDWRLVVEEHRATLLSQLDLKPENVDSIHYILIAGLSKKTEDTALRKARNQLTNDYSSFFCFDDLSNHLYALRSQIRSL